MAKIIIFGVGQISEIAYYYLTHDSEHEVVAFTVDKDYINANTFHELPVEDFDRIEKKYPTNEYKMFLPISYKKVNSFRAEKYYEAKSKGYDFISYISSNATYYDTPVGENCLILEDNVIQPFTKIGDNCILWSGNHIGHHSVIGDHCFISSHVVVSGSVNIGDYSFIGVNATISDNVTLGEKCVIGANALIMKNTEDNSVYKTKQAEKSKVSSDRLLGL